jgi:hypothetical protein
MKKLIVVFPIIVLMLSSIALAQCIGFFRVPEGSDVTVTIEGSDYLVKADYVGPTRARFVVNGEYNATLEKGQSFKLADRSTIQLKNLYSGDPSTAEFCIERLGTQRNIAGMASSQGGASGGGFQLIITLFAIGVCTAGLVFFYRQKN